MKKILIIQTGMKNLSSGIKNSLSRVFPNLDNEITYSDNFEEALGLIPKDGDITIITSNVFHDDRDIKYSKNEKTGSRLAEEAKKINPQTKVFVFSSRCGQLNKWVDGFYQKTGGGWNDEEEIIKAFYHFGLAKKPKQKWKKVVLCIFIILVLIFLIKLFW